MIWQLIAALCSGTFAGAAIYISAVEHPARLECGSLLALREFVPSYRRATVMQASLAAVGCLAAAAAWSTGRGSLCLLGAILLGSVIPFTLIVILPTNKTTARSVAGSTIARGRRAAASMGKAPRRA
jgi:hypothetical protein